MGKCQWRGYRGVGLSCISGCAEGETEIVENTNNRGKKDQTCNGGLQSYCCAGFKSAPTKAQLEEQAAKAAKAAAEAAAANAALDLAAKVFCRVAVPALLAPLELLEDVIPIIGEIAATPAIIRECVKGVEKEGKAEFKVFGKKHTLDINKPTGKPADPRPPPKTYEPLSTKSKLSKTNDHQSKTAHHSATRSPSASATREPYRCLKNGCGESCALKRSVQRWESSNSALDRRTFYSMGQDGDVEKTKNKKGNRDISSFKNRATGWIPFDGSNRKSVTIVGLEGCTVIAAMSNAGMIVSHLFEDVEEVNGRKDVEDTLNPAAFAATLKAVKVDIQAKLAAHPGGLNNGQLLVMVPKNANKPSVWKYDTERWDNVDKNGKKLKGTVTLGGMVEDILDMAKEATGLTDPKVVPYIPPKDVAEAEAWIDTAHGTFAVQYDPANQPGQQARQIWCENVPAWPQPFTWPSTGA